jgi:putative ABC transport system substrate-binding protein
MLGWVEGSNLRMDYRFADGDPDRFAAYAEELVNLRPDLILALTGLAARAVQQRTAVIPIVFVGGGDPASTSLVGNIARPSGNMTGFANLFYPVGGKWLELFKEAVPGLSRVAHVVSAITVNYNPRSEISTTMDAALKRAAVMFNPDLPPVSVYMPSLETAARSLKVESIIAPVHSDVEIGAAIIALGREPGGGLVVVPDGFVVGHTAPIILAAARSNVPTVYSVSDFAREGGLLSYGPDFVDNYRRAASYVDRILRGEKPADLPVQFPTKR